MRISFRTHLEDRKKNEKRINCYTVPTAVNNRNVLMLDRFFSCCLDFHKLFYYYLTNFLCSALSFAYSLSIAYKLFIYFRLCVKEWKKLPTKLLFLIVCQCTHIVPEWNPTFLCARIWNHSFENKDGSFGKTTVRFILIHFMTWLNEFSLMPFIPSLSLSFWHLFPYSMKWTKGNYKYIYTCNCSTSGSIAHIFHIVPWSE